MRLVEIPSYDDKMVRFINADLVTELAIYPLPEDTAYWEVSLSFGEYYIERRFKDRDKAISFMADVAGVFFDVMKATLG